MPAVESDETADASLVRAEMPGMKREDVEVELRGSELRITGGVKEEDKGEGKPLRRRHGKFAYRTNLPTDADADKIDAQLADGIFDRAGAQGGPGPLPPDRDQELTRSRPCAGATAPPCPGTSAPAA